MEKKSNNGIILKPGMKYLQRKTMRNDKKQIQMKREINNLANTWALDKVKKKDKKRLIKAKVKAKDKELPKRKRGRPKLIKPQKTELEVEETPITKYSLDCKFYYDLIDLLQFLKTNHRIDYENNILKDEQKQEFKVKLNKFFQKNSRIYNKSKILIPEDYVHVLFTIIAKFIHLDVSKAVKGLNKLTPKIEEEKVVLEDYLHQTVFSSECPVKMEVIKKKYIKH